MFYERSEIANEKGKYPYKHRSVRSAMAIIKRYYYRFLLMRNIRIKYLKNYK